jgi:hypothetical protein
MAQVKLKAATIVEALVSLVVIAMAFSTSIFIYVNVTKADNMREKLHAGIILRHVALHTQQYGSYDQAEIELGNGKILKNVTSYKNYNNAYLLQLYYLNGRGDTVGKYQELIQVEK